MRLHDIVDADLLWSLLAEITVLLDRFETAEASADEKTSQERLDYSLALASARCDIQTFLRHCFVQEHFGSQMHPDSKTISRISEIRTLLAKARASPLQTVRGAAPEPCTPRYTGPAQTPKLQDPLPISLTLIKGKWTKTYAGHAIEDTPQTTTPVGRLKKAYDQQVKNILVLEKERNALQVRVATLEQEPHKGRKG
ncbi:hypothetical protein METBISCDRAFT_25585 [Metschnikowia bicuspidata]|uniref:Uncharacterized protein n=1 Tax=Metschnikowia bicuspidata TaxID=27322 RepID=A0A4P9ZHL0_9ASCO|nr:hypothetical protein METBISCDRAFT_25585 [Metschnikowia bicuspidata]